MSGPRFKRTIFLIVAPLLWGEVYAQPFEARNESVEVDEYGVLRWQETGDEVALFGVNYSTPFAHAYRAHEALGLDHKTAIDRDVAHFARLRLDAFRIHVWDREVSDATGNLVENAHLDLLDYLIARLKEHEIKIVLTPIAWWGTGYPEPDPSTSGFSERFSKEAMTHDPEALAAITTYLPQFVEHVNPYTGLAYGDDPDILFIELFNEPWHTEPYADRTAFIDTLVAVVRATGFEKPIFYNINERYTDGHGAAICSANIQGVGGQWYPTRLVSNRSIEANMLPNVNEYAIPWAETAECSDKARMIYEFDAADVADSYMYPAMARSFRQAGFQFATMFSYDPVGIAPFNTEYPTHYLNLVYTPAKAISLMIAGEVFQNEPRNRSYGDFPINNTFGSFRVSSDPPMSEMVTEESFFYSGSTTTRPPAGDLAHVAGVGESPIVTYDGSGAYFLDRIADGTWQLEVYPDAVQIADPFAIPSLEHEVVRVFWNERTMEINLADLGSSFRIRAIEPDKGWVKTATGTHFTVQPGIYLLSRSGLDTVSFESKVSFYAPAGSTSGPVVRHTPSTFVASSSESLSISATIAAASKPDSVVLYARRLGWRGASRSPMVETNAFTYTGEVDGALLEPGPLEYALAVFSDGKTTTFPGAARGQPEAWNFAGGDWWKTRVLAHDEPLVLFDAGRDADKLLWPSWSDGLRFSSSYVNGSDSDRTALRVDITEFDVAPHDFAIRTFLTPKDRPDLMMREADASLELLARADTDSTIVEVALVEQDGMVWGAQISLSSSWESHRIKLDDLEPVPLVLLPRPYPPFQPYEMLITPSDIGSQNTQITGLQIRLAPTTGKTATVYLDRVLLERPLY